MPIVRCKPENSEEKILKLLKQTNNNNKNQNHHMRNIPAREPLAGSVGKAWDSGSRRPKFELHVEYRDYLKKKKISKNL